jgi:hypothetical protein
MEGAHERTHVLLMPRDLIWPSGEKMRRLYPQVALVSRCAHPSIAARCPHGCEALAGDFRLLVGASRFS